MVRGIRCCLRCWRPWVWFLRAIFDSFSWSLLQLLSTLQLWYCEHQGLMCKHHTLMCGSWTPTKHYKPVQSSNRISRVGGIIDKNVWWKQLLTSTKYFKSSVALIDHRPLSLSPIILLASPSLGCFCSATHYSSVSLTALTAAIMQNRLSAYSRDSISV